MSYDADPRPDLNDLSPELPSEVLPKTWNDEESAHITEDKALWMFVAYAKANANRPELIWHEANRMLEWMQDGTDRVRWFS